MKLILNNCKVLSSLLETFYDNLSKDSLMCFILLSIEVGVEMFIFLGNFYEDFLFYNYVQIKSDKNMIQVIKKDNFFI